MKKASDRTEKRKYPENRIEYYRRKKGLSQEGLAQATVPTTTNQMIGYLERGERELTYSWMERLAKPLGLSATPTVLAGPPPSRESDNAVNALNGTKDLISPHDKTSGGVMTEEDEILRYVCRMTATGKARALRQVKLIFAEDQVGETPENPTKERA